MPSPALKRRWFSFSLRRMMLAFALLSVVFAGLRWWYVRVYTQDWVVQELRELDCEFDYEGGSDPDRLRRHAARERGWLEKFQHEAGHPVRVVKVKTPFPSAEDAERANELLRRLPCLEEVWIWQSLRKAAKTQDPADRDAHAAVAIQGLPLSKAQVWHLPLPGGKTAEELARMPRLEEVAYVMTSPEIEDLKSIVSNPALRTIAMPRIDAESINVISAASQLTKVHLHNPPTDAVGPLVKLRNCELSLTFPEATDVDLQAVAELPNLTRLLVWGGPATDEGASALARATRLRQLYLHYLRISDRTLMALENLPDLEDASFVGSEVTETGLTALAQGREKFHLVVSEGTELRHLNRLGLFLRRDTVDRAKQEKMRAYPPVSAAE